MSLMTQRAPQFAASAQDPGLPGPGPLEPAPAVSALPRRRGRPPLCTTESVLDEIRTEAALGGLFRTHVHKPALYARARRIWGTWGAALQAAGLDPLAILEAARARAIETRRRRRQRPQV